MLSDSGAPHLREHSWTLDFHWSLEQLNRDSTGLRTHDSTGLRNPSSTYPEFHRTPTLRTWYSTGLRIPGRWNPEFHRIPPGILPGPGIPAEFRRNSGSIFTRDFPFISHTTSQTFCFSIIFSRENIILMPVEI